MFASTWHRLAFTTACLTLLAFEQSATAQPGDPQGDPLPPAALQRLGTTRFRQGSRILTLAYSPSKSLLVSAGGDDPVHLWDATNGNSVRTFPDRWVQAVAFNSDGTLLATGGGFKNIKIWEVASGRLLSTLKGHKATVSALLFADGNTLLSASHDRTIKVWDVPGARENAQLSGHEDEVNCLALSPDGKTLVSGGGDRSVRFWSLPNRQLLGQADGGCAVAAVVFLEDGKQVASTGDDGLIRIWEAQTRNEVRKWKGHDGSVVSLLYHPGSKQLISGGLDRTIRVWKEGAEVRQIQRHPGDCDALAVSPDGQTVAAGGGCNTIRRWELGSGKEIQGAGSPRGGVTGVAFSVDGKTVALAANDAVIRLYDALAGKEMKQWSTPHRGELLLAISGDGRYLASGAGAEDVRLWEAATGAEVRTFKSGNEVAPVSLAFSLDGKALAIGYRDNKVLVHNLGNASAAPTELKQPGVQAVAFTTDGKTLVVCSSDRATLWDLATAQPGKTIKTPPVASVACSPDRRTFATGHHDSTIKIWDGLTGAELRTLEGHSSSVFSVVYSTTGQMLLSGSFDGTVRVWEAASGQLVSTWKGHRGPVLQVAFSPDGRKGCSGSADTTGLIWDVTGRSPGGKITAVDINGMTERLWNDLAAESVPTAHQALWTLVASGENGVEFLHKSVFLVDRNTVEKLIRDLDSNKFAVRERATIQLGKYGRWIEGRLEEAKGKPASLEVKLRIEDLLRKLRKPGGITLQQERLRAKRVLEILEQSGTVRAQELLRNLTRGAVETDLSAEAQLALDRLARRKE